MDGAGVVRLEGNLRQQLGGPEFLVNSDDDYILLFLKYVRFNGRFKPL